jgi:hypothetical protein
MHLGEEDEFISKPAQAEIKAALAGKADATVYSYPGQRHARMTCTQGDAINSLVFDCVYAIICSMNIIIDTDVWVEHSYAKRL